MFRCNCTFETRSGCAEPQCPHYDKRWSTMPVTPGDPLVKITLNLYTDDVEKAKVRFGQGWSAELREIIHLALAKPRVLTVGDLLRTMEAKND